jgi:hypothetical protein
MALKTKPFKNATKITLVKNKWPRFCKFDMCGKDFVHMGGTNVMIIMAIGYFIKVLDMKFVGLSLSK